MIPGEIARSFFAGYLRAHLLVGRQEQARYPFNHGTPVIRESKEAGPRRNRHPVHKLGAIHMDRDATEIAPNTRRLVSRSIRGIGSQIVDRASDDSVGWQEFDCSTNGCASTLPCQPF